MSVKYSSATHSYLSVKDSNATHSYLSVKDSSATHSYLNVKYSSATHSYLSVKDSSATHSYLSVKYNSATHSYLSVKDSSATHSYLSVKYNSATHSYLSVKYNSATHFYLSVKSLLVQTTAWLPVFGIFYVGTDVDACNCTRGLLFFLFLNYCFVPCGKFGSPYLGKAQSAQEQRYPFLSVCAAMFVCPNNGIAYTQMLMHAIVQEAFWTP